MFADATLPLPTQDQLNALSGLGFLGAVLIGVVLVGRGIVIFRREKDASDAEKDARLAEMRTDRDGWKSVAERSVRTQEKQADVAEATSRDIAKLADAVERIATILGVRPPV